MHQGKTFLSIIPARGGSKRLPNKNISPLSKKPLISWSINAALDSSYIDKVIVSSDDDAILTIAKSYGADYLKRPDYLSTDQSNTIDVILNVLHNTSHTYDYIILLQPTSPLRTKKHIDEAIELLLQKDADSIVSVTEASHSPLWTNTLPFDMCMKDFIDRSLEGKRSQDLDTYYSLNGALYIVNTQKIKLYKSFIFEKTFAYIMSPETSIDIDTEYDYICAQAILDKRIENSTKENANE